MKEVYWRRFYRLELDLMASPNCRGDGKCKSDLCYEEMSVSITTLFLVLTIVLGTK